MLYIPINMNIIENSPSIGADEALGPLFSFQNNKYPVHLPISYKFFPSNDILTVYPFKYIGNPCLPCLKRSSQGHDLYIHIVVLESSMLHQCFMPSFFEIGKLVPEIFEGYYHYRHGGHLGHVTWIIYLHIGSPFL